MNAFGKVQPLTLPLFSVGLYFHICQLSDTKPALAVFVLFSGTSELFTIEVCYLSVKHWWTSR